MEKPDFDIDVTGFWLPATKDSKYAHALNWTPWGRTMQPLCGVEMPNWTPGTDQDHAYGKPPCPKCIRKLRHHLRWVTAILTGYENLDWSQA